MSILKTTLPTLSTYNTIGNHHIEHSQGWHSPYGELKHSGRITSGLTPELLGMAAFRISSLAWRRFTDLSAPTAIWIRATRMLFVILAAIFVNLCETRTLSHLLTLLT